MDMVHCKYDNGIKVNFTEKTDGVGKKGKEYDGPRQILCPLKKQNKCDRCGWNPAVERKRKEQKLGTVHGYIDTDGKTADRQNEYRGFVYGKV